jgi:hypothetical protein
VDATPRKGYSLSPQAVGRRRERRVDAPLTQAGGRPYILGPPCRIDMAGISVTLEGNNIQLAFEKNDHTTAVVMDPGTAQSLVLASFSSGSIPRMRKARLSAMMNSST